MCRIFFTAFITFAAVTAARADDLLAAPDAGFLPPEQVQAENQIADAISNMPMQQAFWATQLQATRDYGRAYVPVMSQTDF